LRFIASISACTVCFSCLIIELAFSPVVNLVGGHFTLLLLGGGAASMNNFAYFVLDGILYFVDYFNTLLL
jgi:hypothetical protein